ncbi:type II secretion system protein GspG, partial [Escherichia coli]|nr:type II secretion system protein GspG [Escherichia coli]
DRNRSHWSTSKTPSYTKSVSWQHHPEQGLEALIQQPANMADSRNYRTGGYIKRLPKDPWGNDYQYLSPGEKGLFDVYTLGADGQENGEGAGADIGNWNLQEFQ